MKVAEAVAGGWFQVPAAAARVFGCWVGRHFVLAVLADLDDGSPL